MTEDILLEREKIENHPMNIMKDYPFTFLDDDGNKEYITDEWIAKNWKPIDFKKFLSRLDEEELVSFQNIQNTWPFSAREKQRPPCVDNEFIIAVCGRGWGKTMFGANWLIQKIKAGAMYTAIAGATEGDLFKVMISGKSGIIKNAPDDFKPVLNKTERTLTWPNGAITYCYSSESEDGPRGFNLDCAWVDEIVKFKNLEEFWSNIDYALREGENPQTLFTSTPRKANVACARFMKNLIKEGALLIQGASKENHKLSKKKLASWEKRYGGTQKGREELEGIIDLDDADGAVFFQSIIDKNRVENMPEGVFIKRKIVAVDPSNSNNDNSDECGIVVGCLGSDEKAYIIEDYSGRMSVGEWALKAIEVYKLHNCECVVAETNNGGDLVEDAITVRDSDVEVKQVKAIVSKSERAGPVGGLYEQGRVCHIGTHLKLEDQMVLFDPKIKTKGSPDRMDALVWLVTELIVLQDPDAEEWINSFRNLCRDKIGGLTMKEKNGNNNSMTLLNNKEKYFDEFMSLAREKFGKDFSKFSIFNEKI